MQSSEQVWPCSKIPDSSVAMSSNTSAEAVSALILLYLSSGEDSELHSAVNQPWIHLTQHLKNHAHQKRTRQNHRSL